jgi:hypothetical protein
MPLSSAELASAKKAYREMRDLNVARVLLILASCLIGVVIFLFGISLACGMHILDHGKDLQGWSALYSLISHPKNYSFLIVIFFPFLGQAISYRQLQPRYAGNLKLVTEMEKQHHGEPPYGLEQETLRTSNTLRRPILWRIDIFLRGGR